MPLFVLLILNLIICPTTVRATETFFKENFEGSSLSFSKRRWHNHQLQNGQYRLLNDPLRKNNQVILFSTGAKQGSKVAKSDLVREIAPIKKGDRINVSFDMLIPNGYPNNSILILDLECNNCGLPKGPGIRLYLRNGMLRLDRKKMGISDPLRPTVVHQVTQNKWHHIEAFFIFGHKQKGKTTVKLNNQTVLDTTGTNILSKKDLGLLLSNFVKKEAIDRIQIGLTANSNDQKASIYMDNVEIYIYKK